MTEYDKGKPNPKGDWVRKEKKKKHCREDGTSATTGEISQKRHWHHATHEPDNVWWFLAGARSLETTFHRFPCQQGSRGYPAKGGFMWDGVGGEKSRNPSSSSRGSSYQRMWSPQDTRARSKQQTTAGSLGQMGLGCWADSSPLESFISENTLPSSAPLAFPTIWQSSSPY